MSHIKHSFVSGKADGTDATLVKPTNWNADHTMTTDADGVVLGRLAGAGAGTVQELPFGAVLPYGTVLPFAGPTSPSGWLICDGSSLLRSSFPELFAVLGTAYGAVDGAHFSIPDLRGRTIAGLDPTGTRLTAASISPNGHTLGGAGGTQQNGTGNIHSTGATAYLDFGNIWFTQASGYVSSAGGNINYQPGGAGLNFVQQNDAVVTSGYTRVAGGPFGVAVDGSSAAFNVVQPTLLMNWIIKT